MVPNQIDLTRQQTQALRIRWDDWEMKFLAAMLTSVVAGTITAVIIIAQA